MSVGVSTSLSDAQPDLAVPVVVSSESDLRSMEQYLLSGDRGQAAVALAPLVTPRMRALTTTEARAAVGAGPRIYLMAEERLLALQELPDSLTLAWGSSARIWQPGLSSESDSEDHPLVRPLEGENPQDVLARRFDLSRPFVRQEIRRIEGVCAYYEGQLDKLISALGGRRSREAQTRLEADMQLLTGREQEVLELLSRGAVYQEIAEELNMSIWTAKGHFAEIKRKLGVRSKRDLIGINAALTPPRLTERQSNNSY